MLVDPVPATFARSTTLAGLDERENPRDTLPTRAPVVNVTALLPIAPCPDWHRKDVSDSHVDRSHPVWPKVLLDVNGALPIFRPCTVTLVEPVPAIFTRRSELAVPVSKEKASEKVFSWEPADAKIRLLPFMPWPDRPLTEVSDPHAVCSHAVDPNAVLGEYVAVPKPEPCNVTLVDPVAAALARLVTLRVGSPTEIDTVRLPRR